MSRVDRAFGVIGRTLIALGTVSFIVHAVVGMVVIAVSPSGSHLMPGWIWWWLFGSLALGAAGLLLVAARPSAVVKITRGVTDWVLGR